MNTFYERKPEKKQPERIQFNNIDDLDWCGLTLIPINGSMIQKTMQLLQNSIFKEGISKQILILAEKYKQGIFSILDVRCYHTRRLKGCYAFLPLSEYGVRLIETDNFDGSQIEPDALAADFNQAKALYWWVAVSKKGAHPALALMESLLNRQPFLGKPVFARAFTDKGLKAMLRTGFEPIRDQYESVGCYFVLRPSSGGVQNEQ